LIWNCIPDDFFSSGFTFCAGPRPIHSQKGKIQINNLVIMKRSNLWAIGIGLMAILMVPFRTYAQHACGTQPTADQIRFMDETREARQHFEIPSDRTQITWVPIQFHVVNTTAGTGGLDPYTLGFLLSDLNIYYANSNIQFFECGSINTINDDVYFDFITAEEPALGAAHDVSGVINIYFVNTLSDGNGAQYCGYAYFPGGPDRIMMRNSCTYGSSTFIHEVGHYFTLYHTHGKTNSGTTDELVDGSNCATAGDDICDTPADPNLWGLVDGSCNYTGTALDGNNQPFTPMTTNIMSYSTSTCRDQLTPGQYSRVAYAALNDRSYLNCAVSSPCENTIVSFPYTESFENGLGDWTQIQYDHFDFTHNSGGTPTPNTGPSGAQDGTYYVYAEGSAPNPLGGSAALHSPCFDFSLLTSPQLKFWYNMNGVDVGMLLIQASLDGGATFLGSNIEWNLSGDQGTGWHEATVDLSAYAGNPAFRFRFGVTLLITGELGDIAFDNVRIEDVAYCPGPAVTVTGTGVDCNGNSTGSASVAVSGGNAPFTYLWADGSTTTSISGLRTGPYTVAITDGLGCRTVDGIIIAEPDALSLSFAPSNASSPVATDGSLDVTVSGGTAPFTYSWSNGATTEDLGSVSGGLYSVTVTDANGCSINGSADVKWNCGPLVNSFPYIGDFENGLGHWFQETADDFDWTLQSGSTPTPNTGPSGAFGGSYYVYADATDGLPNGGQAILRSHCFDISALSNPSMSFRYHITGADIGLVIMEISTDAGYSWASATFLANIDQGNQWNYWEYSLLPWAGQSQVSFRYTVISGSGEEFDFAIDEVRITDCAPATLAFNTTDESLPLANNGAIDLTVSGGQSPFSYAWSNGASTEDISGLAPGTYYVTVTDAAGCAFSGSATVNAFPLCSPSVSSFPYNEGFENGLGVWNQAGGDDMDWTSRSGSTPSSSTGPSGAHGGSTYLYTEASGGNNPGKFALLQSECFDFSTLTAPELRFWYHMYGSNMGTLSIQISTDQGSSWSGNLWSMSGNQGNSWYEAVVDLSPYQGYFVQIRITGETGNGYRSDMAIDDISILGTVPPCTPPSISMAVTDVNCNGDSDGALSATASGGVAPYSYLWSTAATTSSINSVSAGTYTLTVTDNTGCQANANGTVSEPAALSLSLVVQNTSGAGQSDGAIDLNVSGGTTPYDYLWSNGATTEDVSGLSAGNYTAMVTDANGCFASISSMVNNASPCMNGISDFPYAEGFENGLGVWTQSQNDHFDWTRKSGNTSTGKTGPSGASEGSWYLYAESNSHNNKTAILNSPCIDLNGLSSPELRFDASMYGSHMGNLTVRLSSDGGASWPVTLFSKSGNQGKNWFSETIGLTAFAGSVVHIRFEANIGSGNRSDIAIDKIQLIDSGLASDPLPVSLESPEEGSVRMYPNPAGSLVNIEFFALSEATAKLRILDLSGRVHMLRETRHVEGQNNISLDLSGLAGGIYLVEVVGRDLHWAGKLVVSNP
jgi:hypothetical protein